MSGIEVAGIVLAVLPLVISALEHYGDGITTAKRFWRYKSEIRSLILQIKTERSIFVNTIEQLLTGIVETKQMTRLMSLPEGEVWKEAGVEAGLKDRLRGAYEIYLDNVRSMEKALRVMMEKLALDSEGKPQFQDPSLFKQEFKRLKFSLTKSEYTEQLKDLRNFNQALIRLTKQSIELQPSRTESKTRSCPNFGTLQNYARSLFETLRSGLRCDCSGHAVKLRLENRSKGPKKEENLLEQIPFRVIFTYSPNVGCEVLPTTLWNWKEADIRCMEEKPTTADTLLLPGNNGACSPPRRVKFEQVQVQPSDKSTTVIVPDQRTKSNPIADLGPIQDLCSAIVKLQQTPTNLCIGYLIDSMKRKHEIYPLALAAGSGPQEWTAYTLRQVLTREANINRRLTQHDKLRVAVDLASSVLQLYNTPWIGEAWNHDNVYFIHRPGVSDTATFEHPFVYREFTSTAVTQPLRIQKTTSRVIRNQTLFTLGILLIEVLYGKPIEELKSARDLDCQGTPGVGWCTAERLIEEELEYEAGPRYLDAVRRCIRCDFNRKSSSLDDAEFQQAVFDGVVAPLEKTLRQFTSIE